MYLARKCTAALLSASLVLTALPAGGWAAAATENTEGTDPMSYLKGDVSNTVYMNTIAGSPETAEGEAKRLLFDHKADTWFTTGDTPASDAPVTVSFTLYYGETIGNYALVSADDPAMDPKSWTLSGRNADTEAWTVIDSRQDEIFDRRGQRKIYQTAAPASYSQYQLAVTESSGGGGVRLAELQLATGEDVNLHLTWPTGEWSEGTPQDWVLHASEEEISQTLEAFDIAYNRLLDAGYNIGRSRLGGGPNALGAWGNYANLQCEGDFNDNTGDPWNMGRKWGMLAAARPGVVFALKGNMAATLEPTRIPYGNDLVWADPASGESHLYQVFSGDTTVKKKPDGQDAGWPGYGVGTGAAEDAKAVMEEAYIQSGWYNESFSSPYAIGFPAAKAQQEGDVWFQEFFGNDSAGASPQESRQGDYGISYLVAAGDGSAYLITDTIFTAWTTAWQHVDTGTLDRFGLTGAPVGNQYTDENGNTVQDFEKARVVVTADGGAQVLLDEGRFTSLSLSGDVSVKDVRAGGQDIVFLVEEGTDCTALAFTYTLGAGVSCDIPSGQTQDFSQPVSFTLTSHNGTKTVYTVTVLTESGIAASDREAAASVVSRIGQLPAVVYLNQRQQVEEAQRAYEALSPAAKLLVPKESTDRLEECIARIQSLDIPIRVTCVGDSITEGIGGSPGKSYPSQMQEILGDGFSVYNAGVSGTNILSSPNTFYPYWWTDQYGKGKEFQPEIVIMMLGTNDATDGNWKGANIPNVREAFKKDYRRLIQEYKSLTSSPYIYIALPPTPFDTDENRKQTLANEVIPALKELAAEENTGVIDMHTFTAGHPNWFGDGLHPNDQGYGYMAAEFARYVTKAAERISCDRLADLVVGGQTLEGFRPDTFQYTVRLEDGEPLPVIAAAPSFDAAETVCTQADENGIAAVTVTSADGRYQQVYTVTFTHEEPSGLPGDFDKDGRVSIIDVMCACKVLARKSGGDAPSPDEIASGDLDQDGDVSIEDVMAMCKILARQ